ncbi:MAG: LysM peptidoglycan-binding domain-containing protein, partial [Planctomycetota bacterium]|nr:LysM peptidoglycan-binding domain-containing protein [Planctomycetota bacterium]
MHRDLKLGLALAVLLIGSTTAFFFRNDADPDAGLPQLQNASELDHAVAQRDAAPYLGAPEPAPLPAAEAIAASPWAKPAFLGGSTAIVRNVSVMPDPIQRVIEKDIEPAENTVREMTAAKPVVPELDADGAPIHVVRSGDTLSGLSARYLGSIARFNEIYELNRDQLRGPHDLK